MLLLWNDNVFGVDMKLGTDLFGVTWLTQKCCSEWRAHSTQCGSKQQRTPETSTNIHVGK